MADTTNLAAPLDPDPYIDTKLWPSNVYETASLSYENCRE